MPAGFLGVCYSKASGQCMFASAWLRSLGLRSYWKGATMSGLGVVQAKIDCFLAKYKAITFELATL